MKVIIAGTRTVTDSEAVTAAVAQSGFWITEVVSGSARGVDALGEQWAARYGVPVKRFPADWNRYGKSAGPRRNREMAEYADALIAVYDGESPGTRNMIETAKALGLTVCVWNALGLQSA